MNAKRDCLEKLLAEGLVFVQLDPRVPGVELPAHLCGQPVVGLNLSLNFRIEVFEIDDAGVRASLSFQGHRHLCVLPFEAIFRMGLAEGEGSFIFPESAPPELRALYAAAPPHAEADAFPASQVERQPPPPPPRGRPQLRLVK